VEPRRSDSGTSSYLPFVFKIARSKLVTLKKTSKRVSTRKRLLMLHELGNTRVRLNLGQHPNFLGVTQLVNGRYISLTFEQSTEPCCGVNGMLDSMSQPGCTLSSKEYQTTYLSHTCLPCSTKWVAGWLRRGDGLWHIRSNTMSHITFKMCQFVLIIHLREYHYNFNLDIFVE